MSKAFTKEETSNVPLILPKRVPLPAGVPNYVTAAGLAAYRSEIARLIQERAAVSSDAQQVDPAEKQAQLNVRIAELEARLGSAELVESAERPRDEVRFGATVTVQSALGVERTYQIVGVDEADPTAGRVMFLAPVARALLGRRVGESVIVQTPHGEDELEITRIE